MKIKSIILIFVLVFGYSGMVLAQENTDFSDEMKVYDQSHFSKPVSDQEFNQALNTLKQVKNGKKGRKNANTNMIPQQNQDTKESKGIELPDSPDPLLRLPVKIIFENDVIDDGFYLISKKYIDGNYYLIFKQGHKIVMQSLADKVENAIIPSSMIPDGFSGQAPNTASAQRTTVDQGTQNQRQAEPFDVPGRMSLMNSIKSNVKIESVDSNFIKVIYQDREGTFETVFAVFR